jgi:hypothetical protein
MATITFDTLKFVERLKAAGVSEEHAKAEAEALSEALAEAIQIGQIATKVDIESLRNEIERAKSDIIKWVAGLLIAQGAVIATLVKLL